MAGRFSFPVNVTVDEEGFFLVRFPDLEGAATDGKTREEAMVEARDCLGAALAHRIKNNLPIPMPSAARGRPLVFPHALMAAKAALYLSWKGTGLSCLALSRKLGLELRTLQRMLDPRQRTHIGSIETVLEEMGTALEVDARGAKAA